MPEPTFYLGPSEYDPEPDPNAAVLTVRLPCGHQAEFEWYPAHEQRPVIDPLAVRCMDWDCRPLPVDGGPADYLDPFADDEEAA